MNLPTFPTDNLYKFMAISGLFICIFSIVFTMTRISEIKQKIIELKTKTEILKIETEGLRAESDRLNKDLGKIEKKMILEKLSYKDRDTFRKELSELIKKEIEHGQKITILRIKTKDLKGQSELFETLNKELELYWRFLKIGSIFGFLASTLGFLLWYNLVQRPSDLLLRKQAENIQLEPSKATKVPQDSSSFEEKKNEK